MDATYGSDVDPGDARWIGSSNTFGGSDAIFSEEYSSTLNFDPLPARAIDLRLTEVEFEWGVYDRTRGRDFGLDVYDDATRSWINNIFEVFGASDGDTDRSGVIDLRRWEVTRLRFHDHGTYDVGLDNLRVVDNRRGGGVHTPEPGAATLFGVSCLLLGLRLRRSGAA